MMKVARLRKKQKNKKNRNKIKKIKGSIIKDVKNIFKLKKKYITL